MMIGHFQTYRGGAFNLDTMGFVTATWNELCCAEFMEYPPGSAQLVLIEEAPGYYTYSVNYITFDLGTSSASSGVLKRANNKTNCSHGFGIGVQGGGTAAAGLKSGGVVTGQLGGGLFVNSSGPSVGGYASGALAGRWGSSTGGFPAQSLQAPWVGGAYAGYGPGIFITNAGSPAQLGGPFAVLANVDIGIGIGKASIQFAADKNGTIILTINGGPAPYADGLGFDVSGFTSNTIAGGTGCKE